MRRIVVAICLAILSLLFAAIPTVAAYELYSFRWVCSRTGVRAGTCYAEPTIRDMLPGSRFWDDYPRTWFMQIVSIDDLKEAVPSSMDAGYARMVPDIHSCVRRNCAPSWYASTWQVPVVLDADANDPATRWAVQRFVVDFNAFKHDTMRARFVLHPRAPLTGTRRLFHVAYGVAFAFAALAFRELLRNARADEPFATSSTCRATWRPLR